MYLFEENYQVYFRHTKMNLAQRRIYFFLLLEVFKSLFITVSPRSYSFPKVLQYNRPQNIIEKRHKILTRFRPWLLGTGLSTTNGKLEVREQTGIYWFGLRNQWTASPNQVCPSAWKEKFFHPSDTVQMAINQHPRTWQGNKWLLFATHTLIYQTTKVRVRVRYILIMYRRLKLRIGCPMGKISSLIP